MLATSGRLSEVLSEVAARAPGSPMRLDLGGVTFMDSSGLAALLRPIDDSRDGVPRFVMLETIREYGLECLRTAGDEAEARQRHAAWAADFAERAQPELTGADQQHWFSRLDTEHDNLRAALGWAIDQRDAQTAPARSARGCPPSEPTG